MRPVNLIPAEDRRGDSAPSRTGALSWIVVGVLAAVVLAVGAVVMTNSGIADKEAEVAALTQTEAAITARAESLAAFTSLQTIKDARIQTVAALAESRFDWQRVMEELARVIPAHVWLTSLSGGSGATPGEADANAAVPTMTMSGCALSQRGVARMVAAVGDIDGVTRVSATRSEKNDSETGGASTAAAGAGSEDCRTRNFVPQFEIVAVFDGVPVPAGAVPPAAAAPADGATPAAADSATTETGTAADAGSGQVAAAQATRADQAAGVAEADRKAKKAVGLASGGNG